nr:hypothetical protein [Pandoravirus massiliensis]
MSLLHRKASDMLTFLVTLSCSRDVGAFVLTRSAVCREMARARLCGDAAHALVVSDLIMLLRLTLAVRPCEPAVAPHGPFEQTAHFIFFYKSIAKKHVPEAKGTLAPYEKKGTPTLHRFIGPAGFCCCCCTKNWVSPLLYRKRAATRMDTTTTTHSKDNRRCAFVFECEDACLIMHVDKVARLFPSYSLVGVVLSERWTSKTSSADRGINCRPFTARSIGLILDILADLGPTTTTATKLWEARDDFIAACDFLFLHRTAAGQVADDLRTIGDAVTIKVAYNIAPGRQPTNCKPAAHITVRIQPCHIYWPALRGALFGISASYKSPRRPLIVSTRTCEVSTPCDVVKAARDVALAWSITSPRRIACAALRKESLPMEEYFSCDEEDRGDDYDEDAGAIVAFCPMGVYRDSVVMPIDGVHFVDPLDALPLQRECVDPVCTFKPWLPAHHDPSTVLIVGGTHKGRITIAADLAHSMGHTQTVILEANGASLDDSAISQFDNVTVVRDAVWVDPAPDTLPVVIVNESFPGDPRLLSSVWSARRRRCRTIVTASDSRLYGKTEFDITIGRCDTTTVSALIKQRRRPLPPHLVRSCARRDSAFGISTSLVLGRFGDAIGIYTSGDKAALAQCDTCAAARPHAPVSPVATEPFVPRKVRPGQSAPPVSGDSCTYCMEPLVLIATDGDLFLQCPLCWRATPC